MLSNTFGRTAHRGAWACVGALSVLVVMLTWAGRPAHAQEGVCRSSGPKSYTITLCITAPAYSASLKGVVTVVPTSTVTGDNPGIQRLIYTLNRQYLLTAVAAPYSFDLPTTYFVDGVYPLTVEALMRDGYITAKTTINVTFANGIKTLPVNANTFTPHTPAALPNQSLLVAAVGDGAGGRPEAAQVSDAIIAHQVQLFLYLGDVYERGTPVEFYNWYGTATDFFGRFKAITNPTVGNHEYEYIKRTAPGYFQYWGNIPNYYSYNAGGWHLISLDSTGTEGFNQTATETPQYQWLDQDLNQNTSHHCTVAYWHEPLFTVGPQRPATRMAAIWALLAQKGVDLVLTGHDHNYQRWRPLDANGNPSAQGVTQFVAGMGGHGIRNFTTTNARMAVGFDSAPATNGVLYLALNPDGAEYRFINIADELKDYGVIACTGAPRDTRPPTVPSKVAAPANPAQDVIITWQAAWDNTGVNSYLILRDGISIGTVNGGTLTYTDQSVALNQRYSYRVKAVDLAGNQSAQSNAVRITTPSVDSGSGDR